MLTAFLGLSVSACAQKNVPLAVKNAFTKEYPGVKADWDKEGSKYEASFKMKENSMSVLYSSSGVLEETEMDMKVDMLPAAVKAYLSKNFKTEKIKEAAKITKADGTIEYEAEIKGKDYLFTPKGKFINAVKD